MSNEVYSIAFYLGGERSAPAIFPGGLPEGVAMIKQVERGELMTGIAADAAELRRGGEVILFHEFALDSAPRNAEFNTFGELWRNELQD
jgi:hypothetical protein